MKTVIVFILGVLLSGLIKRYTDIRIEFFCYGALALAWKETVIRRITDRRMMRCLTLTADLVFLFLMARSIKYVYMEGRIAIGLAAWYSYGVLQMLIAMVSFLMAVNFDSKKDYRRPLSVAVMVITAILSILVLTNNIHQLAYRFHSEDVFNDYSRGPLYFLFNLWTWGLLAVSLFLLFAKCRLTMSRRYLWLPVLILLVGGLMVAGVVFFPDHFPLRRYYMFSEIFCITIILYWESLIQIGYIPSCSEYNQIFDISTVAMTIVDDDLVTRRSSRTAKRASEDKDHLKRSHKIEGGTVYWYDDISKLNRINDEIRTRVDLLSEENELIAAQNEMNEKKKTYEVTDRIYTEINNLTRSRSEKIKELVETGGDLALIAVYGAYIKRKANLYLLASQSEKLPVMELFLSIRDSLDYVKLGGTLTSVFMDEKTGSEEADPAFLNEAFDRYQEFIEKHLPDIDSVSVVIRKSEDIEVRMELAEGEEVFYERIG